MVQNRLPVNINTLLLILILRHKLNIFVARILIHILKCPFDLFNLVGLGEQRGESVPKVPISVDLIRIVFVLVAKI